MEQLKFSRWDGKKTPVFVDDQGREFSLPPVTQAPPATPAPGAGVGDVVAAATGAVGVRPCGGCAARQALLNRAFPLPASAAGLVLVIVGAQAAGAWAAALWPGWGAAISGTILAGLWVAYRLVPVTLTSGRR